MKIWKNKRQNVIVHDLIYTKGKSKSSVELKISSVLKHCWRDIDMCPDTPVHYTHSPMVISVLLEGQFGKTGLTSFQDL